MCLLAGRSVSSLIHFSAGSPLEDSTKERSPSLHEPSVAVGQALKIISDCSGDCKEASRLIVDLLLPKGFVCQSWNEEKANALAKLEKILVKLDQKKRDGKFAAAPQIYQDHFLAFKDVFAVPLPKAGGAESGTAKIEEPGGPPHLTEAPNALASCSLLQRWNMPEPSRPTLPDVAMKRPEEPVVASLARVKFEELDNGNARASLVMENLWITASFRHPEALEDAEGERVVTQDDMIFDVSDFLEYMESGDEPLVAEVGPSGTRALTLATAEKHRDFFNANGCKFDILPDNHWYCQFCCKKFRVQQKSCIVQHISRKRHKKAVFLHTAREEFMTNPEVVTDIGQEMTECFLGRARPKGSFFTFTTNFIWQIKRPQLSL